MLLKKFTRRIGMIRDVSENLSQKGAGWKPT
jgi:hypothetical protein